MPAQKDLAYQSGLSPSGGNYFLAPGLGIGAPPPSTLIGTVATLKGASVVGHSACLFIDEEHLLAPDAVIRFQSDTQQASVTALAAGGVCAGRFPGGL